MEILDDIDRNYINKKKQISKTIKSNMNYRINFDKLNKRLLYLKNNDKTIYSATYNFYGIIKDDMWIWANSIDGINNNIIKNVHKLKQMNSMFKNKNNNNLDFYYKLLTNNTIRVKSKQIKQINKLLMYLNNDIIIFNPVNKHDIIQFIGINKIIENYL